MIYKNKDGTFAKGTRSGKQFKKGNIPWNKGKKGLHLNPTKEFKENEYVGENHPSWKGGVQVTKRDGVFLWDGKNKRIKRSRKVYEDTYGSIPMGYVIYHLDGDIFNDDPQNLEAISRAELAKRNALKGLKRG